MPKGFRRSVLSWCCRSRPGCRGRSTGAGGCYRSRCRRRLERISSKEVHLAWRLSSNTPASYEEHRRPNPGRIVQNGVRKILELTLNTDIKEFYGSKRDNTSFPCREW